MITKETYRLILIALIMLVACCLLLVYMPDRKVIGKSKATEPVYKMTEPVYKMTEPVYKMTEPVDDSPKWRVHYSFNSADACDYINRINRTVAVDQIKVDNNNVYYYADREIK